MRLHHLGDQYRPNDPNGSLGIWNKLIQCIFDSIKLGAYCEFGIMEFEMIERLKIPQHYLSFFSQSS